MGTVTVDSPYRAEWDLLHALRAAPELLSKIAAASGDELQLQTQLRREYPDELVRGAFALCELRKKGAKKFSRADRMWFDRRGLEQATAELVARHKAQRFEGAVYDLCCGIGGDTLALAERCVVTAVDRNPVATLRTNWNAEVYDVADKVSTLVADAGEINLQDSLVHIDPDRRTHGPARAVRVEDYEPGPEFLQQLMQTARGGAIKLSPAANFIGKFPEAEIELVSLHGECKEAIVWFGELRQEAPWRATVLPEGAAIAGHPLDVAAEIAAPLRFIFDTDPAVVRSGLVDTAAVRLGLNRLDREEEYLTGDNPQASPFVQVFEVLAELPNHLPEIRAYFRTSNFGQLEIKCRRIPIDIEAVRRRVTLPGSEPGVLIFARANGRARAYVCRRVATE